tara:strand:+ start:11941 stop:12870 length:930 start_codon:yes stop_codon:yes gene_type:complete
MTDIARFIADQGTVTGAALAGLTKQPILELAKNLGAVRGLHREILPTRYLRIDADSPNGARISPSFLRGFLNYTCFGFDRESVETRVLEMQDHYAMISARKRLLARQLAIELFGQFRGQLTQFGVFVGGDIAYNMAHEETRWEISTGLPVRGSDIDMVFLIEDRAVHLRGPMEKMLLQHKTRYLKHPSHREEIDFIVKTPAEVAGQLNLDSLKNRIATKVIAESEIVFQHGTILDDCKTLLQARGLDQQLRRLYQAALHEQNQLYEKIYSGRIKSSEDLEGSLFYSAELNEFGDFSITKRRHTFRDTQL